MDLEKNIYRVLGLMSGTSMDGIDFDCDDSMCGSLDTDYEIDYTVKLIIDDLTPNTWYYYQFKVGTTYSGTHIQNWHIGLFKSSICLMYLYIQRLEE